MAICFHGDYYDAHSPYSELVRLVEVSTKNGQPLPLTSSRALNMAQPPLDILAQLVSAFRDILLLVIGGLVGFLSSWVVSKRERKWARADQRRERIFGPLQDELDKLSVTLSKAQDVNPSYDSVYERVKAEHIRYMIPKQLRTKVIQLYEEIFPNYENQILFLREKYRMLMTESITKGLRPLFEGGEVIQTSSPHVANLASLSYWLLEGKFPKNMEKEIETAFFVVKEDSREFPYVDYRGYFEGWKRQIREDIQYKVFERLREKAIAAVQEINNTIRQDLESEN